MLDSPIARTFIERILADTKTDEGMEADVRETLINQMLEQLTEMVNAELISSLNQHQMQHIERLLDEQHENHIESYLADQGISNQEVVARAMRRFQLEYTGE
jgi:hypothetical protein